MSMFVVVERFAEELALPATRSVVAWNAQAVDDDGEQASLL